MSEQQFTPRVFSGIQPSGGLTLGNYLGAINGAIDNLNMSSDMKIPGAQQYTGVVLDREVARFLAGEITVDQALANIEEGWEEITDDFGREDQAAIYKLSLGITN